MQTPPRVLLFALKYGSRFPLQRDIRPSSYLTPVCRYNWTRQTLLKTMVFAALLPSAAISTQKHNTFRVWNSVLEVHSTELVNQRIHVASCYLSLKRMKRWWRLLTRQLKECLVFRFVAFVSPGEWMHITDFISSLQTAAVPWCLDSGPLRLLVGL